MQKKREKDAIKTSGVAGTMVKTLSWKKLSGKYRGKALLSLNRSGELISSTPLTTQQIFCTYKDLFNHNRQL